MSKSNVRNGMSSRFDSLERLGRLASERMVLPSEESSVSAKPPTHPEAPVPLALPHSLHLEATGSIVDPVQDEPGLVRTESIGDTVQGGPRPKETPSNLDPVQDGEGPTRTRSKLDPVGIGKVEELKADRLDGNFTQVPNLLLRVGGHFEDPYDLALYLILYSYSYG